MSKQRFDSVWDAIEDTPGDAANMKARAELMRAIADYIRSKGMTQAEAAKTLGVPSPVSPILCAARWTCFPWIRWSICWRRRTSGWRYA